MRNLKRIFSILMVLALMFSLSVSALAADYTAATFEDMQTAFADSSGEDVNINVTADIAFNDTLEAKEGIAYTIGTQNNSVLNGAQFSGSGEVEVNMNLEGDDCVPLTTSGEVSVTVNGDITSEFDGIYVQDNSSVTVTGDIVSGETGIYASGEGSVMVTGDVTGGAEGVIATENSCVEVTGNVTGMDYEGIYSLDESKVVVQGDVIGGNAGVFALGTSSVTVYGDVAGEDGDPDSVDYSDGEDYSDGGDGVVAYGSSTVKVTGNVSGGDSYGTYGYGGIGINVAGAAQVTVDGDVTGGNVTADPNTVGRTSLGGDAIYLDNESGDLNATVVVGGNATGGNTNGDDGVGGSGIYIYYADSATAGSVTVVGNVTAGEASAANGTDGYGIAIYAYEDAAAIPFITVCSYDSVGCYPEELLEKFMKSIVETGLVGEAIATLEGNVDRFWNDVERQIRAAEKGDEITVDAGKRTTMPAFIMDAIEECEVILTIEWDGGEDIVIEEAYQGDVEYTIFYLKDLAELLEND